MFQAFPKLTRFSHGWTITEKLDGTNSQVLIVHESEGPIEEGALDVIDGNFIFAGSRNRLLGLGKNDNHGFAQFVHDNAAALIETLGPGRHFGEWVGKGIQRGYDLDQKVFALFNVKRWTGVDLPNRVRVVPVMAEGYMDNPGGAAVGALAFLKSNGSLFAEGFMNPEGVVLHHAPSGTLFKKTFDYDEKGKWAENQARKEENVG
jgi:hypothetical protein